MFLNAFEFISVNFKLIFKIMSALINTKGKLLSDYIIYPLMNLWSLCLCYVNNSLF